MVILDHFSRHTRLPIKIDNVIGFILEAGFVDSILLHPVEDDDPAETPGVLLRRKRKVPYAVGHMADIAYPARLPPYWQRLICAKELLHLESDEGQWVRTKETVSRLITGIVLPMSAAIELAKINVEVGIDHSGILLALALLFPRDARDELRPLYDTVLSDEQISALAEIPSQFIPLIMSDAWGGVLDQLCPA